MKKKSDEKTINGMLLPMNALTGMPVFLTLQNGKVFLPLFSTKEKYDEGVVWGDFSVAKCKVIEQQDEFLNSAAELKKKISFDIVVNPYVHEGNLCGAVLALQVKV